MTFVDTLAFQLFTLAIVSGLLFYSGVVGYATYRKFGPRRTYEHLKAQAVPLGGIGLVIAGIGFWGEINWPLPGSYNILFFDPYLLLGVVLVGFAVAVEFRWRTQYLGLLAAMTGLMSIYYGYSAYTLQMTKEPLTMFFLYVAMGGTAVFTFPVTLWLDRIVIAPPPLQEPATAPSTTSARASPPELVAQVAAGLTDGDPIVPIQIKILFGGFLLFLLFAAGSAILAVLIGGGALPAHLTTAP
jgi:putative membrane protein